MFLGGGTPSLAAPDELAAILGRLRACFALLPGAEITVECNPESTSPERLTGYRGAGVTRISLGVQSLDNRILTTLGRLHSAQQARLAFDAARAAGFDNVSVDLIYGLPGLDADTWTATVRGVLEWEPDHLSAYGLTLDEGSRWHATGVTGLPPEDTVAEQYWRLTRLAAEAGFEHYEISNYARPGRRSAHNQIYWRAEEYLGLGPGAAGYVGDVRYVERQAGGPLLRPRRARDASRGEPRDALRRASVWPSVSSWASACGDGIPTAWLDERIALEAGALPRLIGAWKERGLLVEDARARA